MALTDFLDPLGTRVHAGVTGCVYEGRGQIWISTASIRGVDANLWGALKHCVDVLGLKIQVNSIDTGQHAPASRHYQGRAVDINRVEQAVGSPQGAPSWRATTGNTSACRLVSYLLANGFGIGERRRGQSQAGVIFGPPGHQWNPTSSDHHHHIHVSIVKRRA
jgi:hypothetical protein